jgi:hypothetical protein
LSPRRPIAALGRGRTLLSLMATVEDSLPLARRFDPARSRNFPNV